MKMHHLYIVTESQLCNYKEDPEHCVSEIINKDILISGA